MAATHLFPLSLSLVAVLIAATYLFAAVHPAVLCNTDPGVYGPFPRACATPYANRPTQTPAIALPGALPPREADLNRRAQWNPHASWPGHDNQDDGDETYCGAVMELTLTAEVGPLTSDCEAIRAWAGKPTLSFFFFVAPPTWPRGLDPGETP